MLLQPFIAALLVYHRLTWQALPALAAVVLVFLVRDPLTVLARQKWVWRGERPACSLSCGVACGLSTWRELLYRVSTSQALCSDRLES